MQSSKRICGAKTRSGKPCQSRPMPNGRCRMHGGKSSGAPLGNKNAIKHGRYSRRTRAIASLICACRSHLQNGS
ncbi:MAG: HGGxSTG domain-containing protein [Pseudomonadota bacterium]